MCLDALNAIPKIPALFVLILWKRYKKKSAWNFKQYNKNGFVGALIHQIKGQENQVLFVLPFEIILLKKHSPNDRLAWNWRLI